MQCKVLYILGATLKIHDRLHTLFGPSHLREAGQNISICVPWVSDSRRSEVKCLLRSRLQTPFFKTRCKQNPLESVAGWPRVQRTAHTLESLQGEMLAGGGGDGPGSHSDLTVPVLINYIHLLNLIEFLSKGDDWLVCLWPKVDFTSYIHSINCTLAN